MSEINGEAQRPAVEAGTRTRLDMSDWLSITALVISVLSFVVSAWTVVEQRRQWRATSLGRIELTSVQFTHWRTLSVEQLADTAWGYDVDIHPLMEGNRVTGEYGVPSRLVARDLESGAIDSQISGITTREFETALAQSSQALGRKLVPAKHFQITADFQNLGATPVSDVVLALDPYFPDKDVVVESAFGQPVDIGPGRTVFRLCDVYAPIEARMPSKFKFRARFRYTDVEGTVHERSVPFYYHSATGSFMFGE